MDWGWTSNILFKLILHVTMCHQCKTWNEHGNFIPTEHMVGNLACEQRGEAVLWLSVRYLVAPYIVFCWQSCYLKPHSNTVFSELLSLVPVKYSVVTVACGDLINTELHWAHTVHSEYAVSFGQDFSDTSIPWVCPLGKTFLSHDISTFWTLVILKIRSSNHQKCVCLQSVSSDWCKCPYIKSPEIHTFSCLTDVYVLTCQKYGYSYINCRNSGNCRKTCITG